MEKAINLVKITGDKVIIIDERENKSLVIMGLAEYEKLAAKNSKEIKNEYLTEREMLDRINRDIVYSRKNEEKEIQGDKLPENVDFEKSFKNFDEDWQEETTDDNLYYYDQEEMRGEEGREGVEGFFPKENPEESLFEGEGEMNRKGYWDISSVIKKRAEEIE